MRDSFQGYVSCLCRHLDYDWQPEHMYEFTLTAVDLSSEPKSGSTTVQVWLTGVDDELPHFVPVTQTIKVKERCKAGTLIHVVQAYDPDGGDISFTFDSKYQRHRIFFF